ncbi:MAG TPA: TolC family protein, partial [Chitinophagaceae bacterium]|nr:TolC family protein [Chitinophagaceae bacterium]
MNRNKFLLHFFLLLNGAVFAQVRPLTLEEAIATSLQNNFDIRLSRNDSTLAALNDAYADYAFYPRLNATGGVVLNRNNQVQELASGAKRGGNVRSANLQGSVNLNWTLFDGLRMFITRRRLGELVELGELQIKNQVVTTVSDVMRTYFDMVRQEQQLRATEEQIQLSEERVR